MPSLWLSRGPVACLLWPLSWLFMAVVSLRRWLYRIGTLRSYRPPIPVIVVGNITVGGVGKTPLVVSLVERLRDQGMRPGVVSRGYGGNPGPTPLRVAADTDVTRCGDEPLMIARRTGVPVCVHPQRKRAARQLVDSGEVDILVSDDGLQHYALARDGEIVVVDGQRGLGNGWRLPAGPLREGAKRLREVDLVLARDQPWGEAALMTVTGGQLLRVSDDAPGAALASLSGQSVHAVAGIGYPARFFDALRAAGLTVIEHPFADHFAFQGEDLAFGDELPVVMTEKDAVKCRELCGPHCWYLPVIAELDQRGEQALSALIERMRVTHYERI